jgi:hypothetical protein
MFFSHNLSLDIQGGMFYWYTDPVVGPGFSEVLTLMRYHHSVNTEKAKSLKLHVDGCEILRGGGGGVQLNPFCSRHLELFGLSSKTTRQQDMQATKLFLLGRRT